MRSRSLRAINARFLNDSGPVRAMSYSYAFLALHEGDGGAGGGAGGDKGDKGKGGSDGGSGGGSSDDDELPIEQQLGAVKSKNRELLGKLAKSKPFTDFAKSIGVADVTKISPEKLARLKAAFESDDDDEGDGDTSADKGKGKGKGVSEARMRALQDGHNAEKKALTDRQAQLTSALDRAMRTNEAQTAIHAEGGNAKLLSGVVDKHVKLIEDEEKPGEFSVVVVDEKGNVRYNKSGKEMTPREFVAELKASGEYDGAFAAPKSNGGGSQNANGGKGKGGSNSKEIVLTSAEARDTATYRAARERAQKENLTLRIAD